MSRKSGSSKDWEDSDDGDFLGSFFKNLRKEGAEYDANFLADKYIKKNIRRLDCKIYRLKNKLAEYGMYIHFTETPRTVELQNTRLGMCQSLLDALESGLIEIDTNYI